MTTLGVAQARDIQLPFLTGDWDGWSEQRDGAVDEEEVAEELAGGDAEERQGDVGTHETKEDGDGGAEDGQEGEETHQRTTSGHERLGTLHALLADVQIALYPVEATHAPHPIVHGGTEHVANGAVDDKGPRLQSRSEQRKHHRLAAEGEEASSQECRQ